MENKREKIKSKIKALLSKTTDNGATKEEMESALAKAKELMVNFFISEHDLTDPYISEKCVLVEVPLTKSGYDMSRFYHSLSELFDCKCYYNNERIAFFGFEEDTQLCAYFYTLITKTCLAEKEKYMKSEAYKELRKMYNGKTLASSFITGFTLGVSKNLEELYDERESELSKEQYGLVVVEKKAKVELQFDELGMDLRKARSKKLKAERIAFLTGVETGEELSITQGVHSYKKESTLALN